MNGKDTIHGNSDFKQLVLGMVLKGSEHDINQLAAIIDHMGGIFVVYIRRVEPPRRLLIREGV
jgi:hypothetical protein